MNEQFVMEIENMVSNMGIPYMDAILLYCERNEMEVEVVAKLVTGNLKSKLKLEAEDLNFLKKTETSKLPF